MMCTELVSTFELWAEALKQTQISSSHCAMDVDVAAARRRFAVCESLAPPNRDGRCRPRIINAPPNQPAHSGDRVGHILVAAADLLLMDSSNTTQQLGVSTEVGPWHSAAGRRGGEILAVLGAPDIKQQPGLADTLELATTPPLWLDAPDIKQQPGLADTRELATTPPLLLDAPDIKQQPGLADTQCVIKLQQPGLDDPALTATLKSLPTEPAAEQKWLVRPAVQQWNSHRKPAYPPPLATDPQWKSHHKPAYPPPPPVTESAATKKRRIRKNATPKGQSLVCPFCDTCDDSEDEGVGRERKTRRRRKSVKTRGVHRFGKWWAGVGYSGDFYCQRCSEVFRDHLMRQKSNSAGCSRLSPGLHTSGGSAEPLLCSSTQPPHRRPWSFLVPILSFQTLAERASPP